MEGGFQWGHGDLKRCLRHHQDVDAFGAVGAPAWWSLLTLIVLAIGLGVSW